MNDSNSLQYEVTNQDLHNKIHHSIKIMEYPALAKCTNILQILPNSFSILILLIETSSHSGHWVMIVRQNNIITFFDSYGLKYDQELKFVNNNVRQQLHENPFLTPLFNLAKKQGFTINYNKKRLQQFSPNINTCGKHVIAFANAVLEGLNLKQYLKLLDEQKSQTGLSYDNLVNELYECF